MNKDIHLIWEAYTAKPAIIKEHHKEDWPEIVLNMSVSKLLNDLKTEKELYENIENFIKNKYKAHFEQKQ